MAMRLDTHQHFWHYNPAQHVWMTDGMESLRRDYLPDDLAPLLSEAGFDGTIAVQARQLVEETEWLLSLAERHAFIRGVVGWVDLRSPLLAEQLDRFGRHPRLVGVRHVVHDEPDDEFVLGADFRLGIAALADYDLAYDLLLYPRHLPVALALVKEFPQQRFVVDHLAKPAIRDGLMQPWRDDLMRLADQPNVWCKLSGMVTEATWRCWRPEDFHPYLEATFGAFGADRLMIGSDWPVCTLSGEYAPTMAIVSDYVSALKPEAQAGVLGGNGARFYGLGADEMGEA